MARREGEGARREGEAPEEIGESLEDYRQEIKEKYPQGEDKKDRGKDEGEANEGREPVDNSNGIGTTVESSSGPENADGATEGHALDTNETESQPRQEAQPDYSGENADREETRLNDEHSSDETSGKGELESIREHLNEKYPREDTAERGEAQPAAPADRKNEDARDPPKVNPEESNKEQTLDANAIHGTGQAEAQKNDAGEQPTNDLSVQEDVGWETPSGHTNERSLDLDESRDSSAQERVRPKEVESHHEVLENGDSKQLPNEGKSGDSANLVEAPPSEDTRIGTEVESVKVVANDQTSLDKPVTDDGQNGVEGTESRREQLPSGKSFADNEGVMKTHLHEPSHDALDGANQEPGSVVTSSSDAAPSDQRIKESPIADGPEDSEMKAEMRRGQLESQSHDAKGEQTALVDAHAYYISDSGKIRLDIDKSALEEALGQNLRDGDMYRIAGGIEGTSSHFEARLSATKSDYVYAFLDGDKAEEVIPGQSYQLRIEQVEKDRTFEVGQGRTGPCIRVYETVLDSLGVTQDGSDGVVQFQVRNEEEGEVRQIYSHYNSAMGWMQIPVGGIGARTGDKVEVISGRRYNIEDAVADFNRQKPESLRNVSMTLEKEKLFLEVDGQRFEAKETRLTSHGLQAVLKMSIAEDGVKFQIDDKTVIPRFDNSDRIREFKTIGDGLYAIRERSKNESHLTQLIPDTLCAMSYGEMKTWSIDKVRVTLENKAGGAHALEVTQEFQELVQRRLAYAGTRRKIEKGNVGEILASRLFESIGLQTVQDHPFSDEDESRGSLRTGPDSVVRSTMTTHIYYTEVKNHNDEEKARRHAISQVRLYCRTRRVYEAEQVSGAFIAITNWDGKTSTVNFRIDEISSM